LPNNQILHHVFELVRPTISMLDFINTFAEINGERFHYFTRGKRQLVLAPHDFPYTSMACLTPLYKFVDATFMIIVQSTPHIGFSILPKAPDDQVTLVQDLHAVSFETAKAVAEKIDLIDSHAGASQSSNDVRRFLYFLHAIIIQALISVPFNREAFEALFSFVCNLVDKTHPCYGYWAINFTIKAQTALYSASNR
jgi:hypothetical protein